MQMMCSDPSSRCRCCCCWVCFIFFIPSAEVVRCDSVSEDPQRQWTLAQGHIWRDVCGRAYLTVWGGEVGGLEGGDNTVCASCPLPASFLSSSVVSMLSRPSQINTLSLFFLLFMLHSLMVCVHLMVNICAVRCIHTYIGSCNCTLRFVCSTTTACTKQHNSMPAGSAGDVRPSALWRVTRRTGRRQSVDPLVSFWWHLYYLFVTLDREP